MKTSQKIVDLLNSLLQNESVENCRSIQFFLSRGVAISDDIATEFIKTRTINNLRRSKNDAQKYLTFTGIIDAIGEVIGQPIVSVYEDDDLIGFAVKTPQMSVKKANSEIEDNSPVPN